MRIDNGALLEEKPDARGNELTRFDIGRTERDEQGSLKLG